RAAALPLQLLPAHLEQRLLGRLLRLPVDADARRRRLRVVQGTRRADPRQRPALPRHGALARQQRGTVQAVQGLARPRPQHRADADRPRPEGSAEEISWRAEPRRRAGIAGPSSWWFPSVRELAEHRVHAAAPGAVEQFQLAFGRGLARLDDLDQRFEVDALVGAVAVEPGAT